MFGRVACLALAVALSIAGLSTVQAANWLEKNFWLSGPNYDRDMPACDYAPALDRIIGRFETKESRFWNSELRIVGIEDIRQTAYLPWAAQSIPRRFCSGTALINDGRRPPIYYSLASGTGIIGATWGVDFGVVGLDRNWAYSPACLAAKAVACSNGRRAKRSELLVRQLLRALPCRPCRRLWVLVSRLVGGFAVCSCRPPPIRLRRCAAREDQASAKAATRIFRAPDLMLSPRSGGPMLRPAVASRRQGRS